MSKKVKILIAVGLAALLLIVGVGIPVLADTTPTPTPPVAITKQTGILDRVAQILNISRDTLVNAMKQAAQELKGQKPTSDDYYNKVAGLLVTVTKDQLVNALKQAAQETRDANINARLDKARGNGIITQDEESEIKDWYANKPSALDKLFDSRLFGGPNGWGWGRFWGGFGGMRGFGRGFKNGPKQPSPTVTPNTTAFFSGNTADSPTY